MNIFLLSVCLGIVVLLHILSDGIVVGLLKLAIAALIIGAIHLVARLRMQNQNE